MGSTYEAARPSALGAALNKGATPTFIAGCYGAATIGGCYQGVRAMSAMRFLLVVVTILAATQIVSADDKKSSTKSGTKSIEVQDYGFGVSMPVTTSRSDTKKSGNGASSVGNTGRSGNRR